MTLLIQPSEGVILEYLKDALYDTNTAVQSTYYTIEEREEIIKWSKSAMAGLNGCSVYFTTPYHFENLSDSLEAICHLRKLKRNNNQKSRFEFFLRIPVIRRRPLILIPSAEHWELLHFRGDRVGNNWRKRKIFVVANSFFQHKTKINFNGSITRKINNLQRSFELSLIKWHAFEMLLQRDWRRLLEQLKRNQECTQSALVFFAKINLEFTSFTAKHRAHKVRVQ